MNYHLCIASTQYPNKIGFICMFYWSRGILNEYRLYKQNLWSTNYIAKMKPTHYDTEEDEDERKDWNQLILAECELIKEIQL